MIYCGEPHCTDRRRSWTNEISSLGICCSSEFSSKRLMFLAVERAWSAAAPGCARTSRKLSCGGKRALVRRPLIDTRADHDPWSPAPLYTYNPPLPQTITQWYVSPSYPLLTLSPC